MSRFEGGASRVRTLRRQLAAGLVGIIAVSTAGCAAEGATEAGGEPAVTVTPSAVAPAAVLLPLDPYLFSLNDVHRLGRAHRILVTRCMDRFGFDLDMPEPGSEPGLPNRNERRYGVVDPVVAARLGYRAAPPDQARQRQPPATNRTPEETAALFGRGPRFVRGMPIPQGGCAGEAQRKLTSTGPSVPDRNLAQRLSHEAFLRSQRDSRVRAVFVRWSKCLAAGGYDYRTPLDPPRDPRFVKGEVTAKEIETATADVACKQRTNLVGVWLAVESAYQRRQIHDNREALLKIQQANRAELTYAVRVAGRVSD
jgi:hypothetical protein